MQLGIYNFLIVFFHVKKIALQKVKKKRITAKIHNSFRNSFVIAIDTEGCLSKQTRSGILGVRLHVGSKSGSLKFIQKYKNWSKNVTFCHKIHLKFDN